MCGRGCGVLAVGRCTTCDEPFCGSHQGSRGYKGVPLVDQCLVCRAEAARQEHAAFPASRARASLSAGTERLNDVLARLAAQGNPSAEPLTHWQSSRVPLLGMKRWQVTSTNLLGWNVGHQRSSENVRGVTVADVQVETFCTTRGEFWRPWQLDDGHRDWSQLGDFGGGPRVTGVRSDLPEAMVSVATALERFLV